ncbi:Lactose permease [Psilocybe cubensis]|uniref:Lactose permease n=1 Tax=Psilocybe cubensis TaxID=181762 RepID=A0ACB8GX23_PSICU|nr:Lactose permease [Psilocybe cubensis]KAH9480303.1 Lactose permease [Psilocybe cubensis]
MGTHSPTHSSIDKDLDAKNEIEHIDSHDEKQRRKPILPQTPMEKQMALQEALKVDPGVSRFSWAAIQMYLVTLVVCCCSGDSGFDGTVMGGINSMVQYQKYFGLNGVGSKTSIVFGIFTVYVLVSVSGTIPASYFPDRFGRRFSMFFGNAVLVVGAVITANAKDKGMFLGGRFLTGLGSSCAGASAKSYLAEMAPAHSRGAYLGFLNSFYYVGQMTATGMMVATGKFNSEMSWRLPLYIQLVPGALNVIFVFLCPESPRWLYSIGKTEQARKILARFHSSTNDPNSPLVDLEMREIEEKIQIDGADKTWWDFRPLFTTRAERYKAYMVILIGQLSGNGLITYFLPILLKDAGITSQNKQLTLNFVNSVTSYIGALTGSAVVDRFGRRKVLLLATSIMVAILATVTGLLSDFGSAARANAGITFIYLFMVVFSFGWTPMQALYPAEVLSYQVRAKGLAFLGIVAQVATLINTFGLPVALQKLGWKVYLIFLIWDVFEVIVIYFFVVETKGFTLEEINEVFEDDSPRKYSERLQREMRESRKREQGSA